MAATATGKCEVCDKPAIFHMTRIDGDVKTTRSFCLEHSIEHTTPEMRDKMPVGPHRTPAEEVAYLREKMALLDQRVADPSERAEFQAETEQFIADIEAGRRRIGNGE